MSIDPAHQLMGPSLQQELVCGLLRQQGGERGSGLIVIGRTRRTLHRSIHAASGQRHRRQPILQQHCEISFGRCGLQPRSQGQHQRLNPAPAIWAGLRFALRRPKPAHRYAIAQADALQSRLRCPPQACPRRRARLGAAVHQQAQRWASGFVAQHPGDQGEIQFSRQ